MRTEALRPYRAALGGRASAPVNHLWIGDSLTEGEGADAFGKRWVDLTLTALRERFQPAGIVGGFGYYATLYLVTEFGGSPWRFGGAAPALSGCGIGQKSLTMDTIGQTLSLAFTGTGADVLYTGGPGTGAMLVSVDGGPEWALETGLASIRQCNVHRIRGLRDGPHVLHVGWGSAQTIIEGAMVYNGDEIAGLRGIEFGHAGWTAADCLHPSSLQAVRATITTYRPALITVNLGTNDCAEGVAPSVFAANLQNLVNEILACCTTPTSLLLFNPYNGAGRSIGHWRPYNAAIEAVAAACAGPCTPAVGVFDLAALFGDMSIDALGLTHDRTHLTNAGNQMWADALASFLAP
ncbi:MAG: SGNH/GDSL hydrolase family protein [Solirubrobacteraceae bacterium]